MRTYYKLLIQVVVITALLGVNKIYAQRIPLIDTKIVSGPCLMTIPPDNLSYSSSAQTKYIPVETAGRCGVPVSDNRSWITASFNSSQSRIEITVTANTGNARTGTVTIENFTTQINQAEVCPTVYSVTGGGSYCSGGSGVYVGLSDSQSGVTYYLKRGSTTVKTLSGSGSALNFGRQTTAGTYTVVANHNTTNCTKTMSGSATVIVNSLPARYSVTGGGQYCDGDAGKAVGLSDSQSGVVYTLIKNDIPTIIKRTGTGSAISFGNQTSGTYKVSAERTSTGCTRIMSGSVTVSRIIVSRYSVTGGGQYCDGDDGVVVGISDSQVGASYNLIVNNEIVNSDPLLGMGYPINFGKQTIEGNYTVRAIVSGCSEVMNGSATVSSYPLPIKYNVTGGGEICEDDPGLTIGLSDSQSGYTYMLLIGSSIKDTKTGTGGSISFDPQNIAGTYTVKAISPNGCEEMMTGSASITVLSKPQKFNLSNGGSFCSGGSGIRIILDDSENGIDYLLRRDGVSLGDPVSGSGFTINFGYQTEGGSYDVVATTSIPGCTSVMNGTAVVVENQTPQVFEVTGGGTACSSSGGVIVGLDGSESNVTYYLKNAAGDPIDQLPGNGSAISFGKQDISDTYTIYAKDESGNCTSNMTGQADVTINPSPEIYEVTGGGQYCPGEDGVKVGISNSQVGVSYNLFVNNTVVNSEPLLGEGNPIYFDKQTILGNYTIKASTPECTEEMNGFASVSTYPIPTNYNITGGGTICEDEPGLVIGLNGSQSGYTYQLMRGGDIADTKVGDGNAINFDPQNTDGTYTVTVITPNNCERNLLGNAIINVIPKPAIFTLSDGGRFCSGENGIQLTLDGSEDGPVYHLRKDGSTVKTVDRTLGNPINFGYQTEPGNYTVLATTSIPGCSSYMNDTAIIIRDQTPQEFNVTGGGTVCSNSGGVIVGLDGSENNVTYYLKNAAGDQVDQLPGDGSPISFGKQDVSDTYTIYAEDETGNCISNMTGQADVTVNPSPNMYNVTGERIYCPDETGVTIGLDGSDADATYILIKNTTIVGEAAGTGSAVIFGMNGQNVLFGTGSYRIEAARSGCNLVIDNAYSVQNSSLIPKPTITGESQICVGDTKTYTATSYWDDASIEWVIPTGAVIVSGEGTDTIEVLFNDIVSEIGVNEITPCGTRYSALALDVNTVPIAFGEINGPENACPGSTESYAVQEVMLSHNYSWNVSGDANINSGQGTNQIEVTFGSQSGTISLRRGNECGFGEPVYLDVTIGNLIVELNSTNDNITADVCGGQSPYTYLWSNGETTQTISTDGKGIYSVRVTDALGDELTQSITLGYVNNHYDYNFIRTEEILVEGVTSESQIVPLSYDQKNVSFQYYDGLGRVVQEIGVSASPAGNDVVQIFEYDELGRKAKEYLPYTTATGNGTFREIAKSELNNFYLINDEANDLYPYAEKIFDCSPLSRLKQQGAPGEAWQINQGHNLEFELTTNSAAIKKWSVDAEGNCIRDGDHAINTLYKSSTKDENGIWSYEYKDKAGKLIMTTAQLYETYYVYDQFDRLAYVLPPKSVDAITGTTIPDDVYNELVYAYKYDEKGRVISKKIPGAGSVLMVYDNLNRLVLTQDSVKRETNQWSFIKYDKLGRAVLSGILTTTQSHEDLQNYFKNYTGDLYELKDLSKTFGYTLNNSFAELSVNDAEIYTATYYDDYNYLNDYNLTVAAPSGFPDIDPNLNVSGLQTGSQIRILESGDFLVTINYYDEKGRVIQSHMQNHMNGTTHIFNDYDFAGKLLKSFSLTSVHEGTDEELENILVTEYEYDHSGRLINEYSNTTTNESNKVLLTHNEYNEQGNLKSKNLHSTDNGNTFLQSVDYTYNIRGWLTGINNPDSPGNDLFSQRLFFNNVNENGEMVLPLYNGNITGIEWKTTGKKMAYNFSYDGLNRLTHAYYGDEDDWNNGLYDVNGGMYNHDGSLKGITYDKNGNILKLARNGGTDNGEIDDLQYVYSGNKLLAVGDNALGTAELGFNDGTIGYSGTEYIYDGNGNMISDANKQHSIYYNMLNLPASVTDDVTGHSMLFGYDAAGVKLYAIHDQSGSTDILETGKYYNGNFVYNYDRATDAGTGEVNESIELATILTTQGRITFDTQGNPRYEYFLHDHLGNVRALFGDYNNDGFAELLQQDHYYPFGLQLPGLSANYGAPNNNYLYNGKELHTKENVNWYDYGARMYDMTLGRWHVLDPQAEKFTSSSPYIYALNNPLRFIDPDGRTPDDVIYGATSYIGYPYEWNGKNPHVAFNGYALKGHPGHNVWNYMKNDLRILYNAYNNDYDQAYSYAKDMVYNKYNVQNYLNVKEPKSIGIDCSGLTKKAYDNDPDLLMSPLSDGSSYYENEIHKGQLADFEKAHKEGTAYLHNNFNLVSKGDWVYSPGHVRIATGNVMKKDGKVVKIEVIEAAGVKDGVIKDYIWVDSQEMQIGHPFRTSDQYQYDWHDGSLYLYDQFERTIYNIEQNEVPLRY
ncbi:MAG: hypothetical protein KQH79_12905 [Bacteroidetes bacterium]|nr:hypothetical protein [Bacteroidota bacterium]